MPFDRPLAALPPDYASARLKVRVFGWNNRVQFTATGAAVT